jgi:hypothetical protein
VPLIPIRRTLVMNPLKRKARPICSPTPINATRRMMQKIPPVKKSMDVYPSPKEKDFLSSPV